MRIFTGLICLFFLLLSPPLWAEAPVWKVSRGEYELYLGGTMHALSEADYPLPAEFEQAYKAADKLVFEIDFEAANSPLFQVQLLQKAIYLDGTDLSDHIRKSTLRKLRYFLEDRGIATGEMLRLRAGMLAVVLTGIELQRYGVDEVGVDQYFKSRADNDSRPTAALESIEQQIEFLTTMGEGKEDEIVLQTIDELNDFKREYTSLKRAWRNGDVQALIDLGIRDLKVFPAAYESLLVNRNRAWIPQIEQMLEDESIEYVLVGVMHLVGDDGVLAMLRSRGYEVERL